MRVFGSFPINNWERSASIFDPCIKIPADSKLMAAFEDLQGEIRVSFLADPTRPLVRVSCRVHFDGDVADNLEGWKLLASLFLREHNRAAHVFYWPEETPL